MKTARVVTAVAAAAVLAGCATGTQVDTQSGAQADTRPGTANPTSPAGPPSSAPTPHGTLLVADFGADTVTFVDPEPGHRRHVLGSVEVGTAPYGLVVGDDGLAWVTTAEGVAVVDTATRTRLARIPYRTGTGPATTGEYRGGGMGIALAPDGRRVYVGVNVPGGNGVLEIVDTATREITGTVQVGRRPFDVDVSADGAEVYATGHDSFDVTAVDTRTLGTRRYEVAPYGTEGGLGSWLKPHYTVVRPTDGRLLLPFEGERLVVLDPRSGRSTIEPMTANTHQHGAAITPDGTLLVVGTGPIVSDDRGPSLTVREPDGSERVVPLDGPHEDVTVSEDGRTAYVTQGFTRDGYGNGVTVVDLTGKRPPAEVPAGTRPLGIAVL
ncbi:YncE family protein [Streptomyces sp. NPDC014734]|uniref:YncE family protein n=1 Tax=Streptomyces sp. NPDC014734 TaxID=3364886 RepID=UPI0036F9479C